MAQAGTNAREHLSGLKRIVVKIGSRGIIGGDRPGAVRFQNMADQIAALRARGHQVMLVSSGAVAMGVQRLGLPGRPTELPQLQAAAAVGQSQVMEAYEAAFQEHGIVVGQVLLTHDGMTNRTRYLNARHAIDALLELGAVPIINENDTVSTEEIEFGDNDQLAAMVASLVGADLLVLLTDVDGLLDETKQRIPLVEDLDRAQGVVWAHDSKVSMGGMASKLGAARRALQAGLPVVIGPAADPDALPRIVAGEDVGTLFLAANSPLTSRKHWIAHTLKPRGTLVVDAGAASALGRGSSLLPAGVLMAKGDFRAGDPICVTDEQGRELARGLVRYDAWAVERLLGAPSSEIELRLGHYEGDELVHRDDLVVL